MYFARSVDFLVGRSGKIRIVLIKNRGDNVLLTEREIERIKAAVRAIFGKKSLPRNNALAIIWQDRDRINEGVQCLCCGSVSPNTEIHDEDRGVKPINAISDFIYHTTVFSPVSKLGASASASGREISGIYASGDAMVLVLNDDEHDQPGRWVCSFCADYSGARGRNARDEGVCILYCMAEALVTLGKVQEDEACLVAAALCRDYEGVMQIAPVVERAIRGKLGREERAKAQERRDARINHAYDLFAAVMMGENLVE